MRVLMKVAGIVLIVALGVTTLPQSVVPSQAGKRAKRYVLMGDNNSLPFNIESLVAATGGRVVKRFDKIGVAVVESADPSFLDAMDNVPGLEVAEDESLSIAPPPSSRLRTDQGSTPSLGSGGRNPADAEFFADQWNMQVIRADEAWDRGFLGDRDVRVAILDTGVDYTHVDLMQRSKIDMKLSKSFFEEPLKPLPPTLPNDFKVKEIADFNGHGTHVAGIIAAEGIFMAGIAPRVTLIIVKVAGRDGFAEWSTILEAIDYAVEVRADVINMSFGERLSLKKKSTATLVEALTRAIDDAREEGAIVVASVGNEAINWDTNYLREIKLPAMIDGVIGASATGPIRGVNLDGRAVVQQPDGSFRFYSDYGRKIVDLAAPGGSFTDFELPPDSGAFFDSILSPCSRFIWFRDGRRIKFPCAEGDDGLYLEGTSMSAAHVSGVAALVDSVKDGRLRGDAIFDILAATAARRGDANPPIFDPRFYGHGRVDAFAAVQCAQNPRKCNHAP